jgi:hypothetical protein
MQLIEFLKSSLILASFDGSPSGITSASTPRPTMWSPTHLGRIRCGQRRPHLLPAVYYDGRFGDTVEERAGGVKASLPF